MKYSLKQGRIEINTEKDFTGQTVTDFLDYFNQSRKNKYLLTINKQIQLNHKTLNNLSVGISDNDIITIVIPNQEIDYLPASKECLVLYEDDFVYVAHKDAGIIIYDEENDTTSLANMAATYQINHNINQPVRYIHRLDKETVGLVLFVKIPFFQPYYDKLLEEKKIKRSYLAITTGNGHIGQKLTYNQPIGKDRHNNNMYRISSTGKEALTKVECLDKKDNYLLWNCSLETGRTHQIRVHMASNKHPIVNDSLYGEASDDFTGMGLWANRIEFPNPITNETIVVKDRFNPIFTKFKKTINKKF